MLILASASPRRHELLRETGFQFEVLPASVEEWEDGDADPSALVTHNAFLKAKTIGELHPERPVLAADTTVALGNEVLNKPFDLQEAARMLNRLSGRTHTVHTGIAFLWKVKNVEQTACVTSRVTFKSLSRDDIESYFQIVNPLDKAGAYGIQEGSERIIHSFEGSYTNIMGLPMETVTTWLERWPELRVYSS